MFISLLMYIKKLNRQIKLKHGQIWVNGKVNTHFDTPLRPDDEVLINHEHTKTTFNNPYLRIVWEDESPIAMRNLLAPKLRGGAISIWILITRI